MLEGKRNLHFGIHQSRRHIKIIRAALRLVRYDLSGDTFKNENKFYRDIGRQLSQGRDFTALLETLNELNQLKGKNKFQLVFSTLRSQILAQRKRYIQDNRGKILETIMILKEHPSITSGIHWAPDYQSNLSKAIGHTYGLAFNSHHICLKESSDENIHEYRKQVKYLRYEVLFIKEAWPALFTALEYELHSLTDLLGQANNLSALQNYVQSADFKTKINDKALNTLINKTKQKITKKAIAIGTRLFAEKPKAFEKRIQIYLLEWKAL